MRITTSILQAIVLTGVISLPAVTQAFELEAYGSIRFAVEAVDPDNGPDNFDSYTGFRDAYSRFGLKATQQINDGWTLMGHLESSFDVANVATQSPFNDRERTRIAKLQLSGPLGTAWYGRGWLAYYNAIAYPVDYFSSFYSGFATFTAFRRSHSFYYATPRLAGFQATFLTSDENRGGDNRDQYTLSYRNEGLTLAIGRDDLNDVGFAISGASASYNQGPWYLAAKYEELDYKDSSNSNDGESVKNLLVQYAVDEKHTVRAMLADVGWDFGDTVFHAGWDYQYRPELKFFVEYYQEETTAAIANRKDSPGFGSAEFNDPADSGGKVLTAGLRFDFSSQ